MIAKYQICGKVLVASRALTRGGGGEGNAPGRHFSTRPGASLPNVGALVASQWKEWPAWFCCLLDLSSGVVSRARFCNFFTGSNSFWNTKNLCNTMFQPGCRNFILQHFSFLHATVYCNFYQVGQLRKMEKCYLKKHALELFRYSYALFDNRFELNSDVKAIL